MTSAQLLDSEFEIRPFTDLELIDGDFTFYSCRRNMDQLIGVFRGDKLIGYISFSLNHEKRRVIVAFIEVREKGRGLGTALIKNLMDDYCPCGYNFETMVSTYGGEEFFKTMLRRNIIPVGSHLIKIV